MKLCRLKELRIVSFWGIVKDEGSNVLALEEKISSKFYVVLC